MASWQQRHQRQVNVQFIVRVIRSGLLIVLVGVSPYLTVSSSDSAVSINGGNDERYLFTGERGYQLVDS